MFEGKQRSEILAITLAIDGLVTLAEDAFKSCDELSTVVVLDEDLTDAKLALIDTLQSLRALRLKAHLEGSKAAVQGSDAAVNAAVREVFGPGFGQFPRG